MINVTCPYCQTENDILFRVEYIGLMTHNTVDCKCEKCNETFEIYHGQTKIEVRKKKNIRTVDKNNV